ncbi:MAG: proteasome regulatory particle subunit RPN11, partial [Watsoniomyces obsoletus]
VDYFKSSLDAALLDTLWNKYWVNTLAASPLLATRALGTGQLTDIGAPRAWPL